MFVGGRDPVLDPSLSEVADGEPLSEAIKDLRKTRGERGSPLFSEI